jgi:hypothetical protein
MTIAVPLAVLALASAGTALGVGPDRVAQLGLVPAGGATDEGLSRAARDAYFPGLQLPRSARAGMGFEGPKREDTGSAVLYSGTRGFPSLGAGSSQTVGGILYPLSSTWSSTLETSIDSGSSRPYRGYGLMGQVHRALPGGWDMSFGLQYNITEIGAPRFSAGAIDSTALPARQWTLYSPASSSYGTTGYELRLNYRYGERNVLGLTYGSGSDFDYTRQMLGMQPSDGRQFGLTGEHWLSPDWALNYGVMAQEQVGPHRGQGLRLGLRYRF